MANLAQMTADLRLMLMAKLLDADIQGFINQAQREEVEAYDWSFARDGTVFYTTAAQNAGTVSFTQGSAVVNGVGTNFFQPPNAVMRIAYGTPIGSMAVPVASVQSPTQLTLTFPFGGTSVTGQSYNLTTSIYSLIDAIGAPIIEIHEVRAQGGFKLVELSRPQLNAIDPSRSTYGGNPPTNWVNAGFEVRSILQANLQIELWPVVTAVTAIVVGGKSGPATMVNPTDIPQIPSAVLEAKAAMLAASALYASNGNEKYQAIFSMQQARYNDELQKAQFADSQRTITKKAQQQTPRYGLDIYAIHDVLGR